MSPRFARRYDREEATDARVEPLFMVEEHDEKRILSWSPDPFDDDVSAPREEPVVPPEKKEPSPRPVARHAAEPPPPSRVAKSAGTRRKARPVSSAAQVHRQTERSTELGRPAQAPAISPAEVQVGESPAPKRGRPRGKVARRQVHFHVDPDEERLLLAAGRMFGSQQKGLIAALESLQEAEFLRDEIDRLRELCERQRRLLAEAESLFKR